MAQKRDPPAASSSSSEEEEEETSSEEEEEETSSEEGVQSSSEEEPVEEKKKLVKVTKRQKKNPVEEATPSVAVEDVKPADDSISKKLLFQRLFTEEDEIALLTGILNYSVQKGADPSEDLNAFYDFVKGSIQTNVSKAQLTDKMRRLKKSFKNIIEKGDRGEDRTFYKSHEQKVLDLSKKIWGKEGISTKVDAALSTTGGCLFGMTNLEEKILKHAFETAKGEEKAALEESWRKLQVAELKLYLQRTKLFQEHASLMLHNLGE